MKFLETHYLDDKERKEYKEKGLFVYDLRGSDTGGDIACIEKSVLVNRVGCIVTNEEIPLGDKYPNDYKDYEEFSKENLIVYSIDELLNKGPKNISDLDFLKFAQQLLKDKNYNDYEIKYITRVKDEHENMYAVAMNGEKIIGFNPLIGDIEQLPEWDFTFDSELFDDLEWNREILYMPLSCHYDIWSEVSSWYPNDIEHKEGLQEYLKYCIEKQIDISKVQEYSPNTPIKNVMQYLDKEETIKQNNKKNRTNNNNIKYFVHPPNSIFAGMKIRENPEEAFENAIKKGMKNPEDWMYMYSENNRDYFKHIDTRIYKSFSQFDIKKKIKNKFKER